MKLARFLLSASVFTALPLLGCGDDSPDPEGAPTISAFSSSKTAVARGERVTLSWTVANATSVSINAAPGGSVVDGSTELTGTVESAAIEATTTFTLKADNANGSTTREVTVTIDANAVAVVSFAANPNPGRLNGTTTLQWVTAGATSVRILEGSNLLHETTTNVANGTHVVPLDAASQTFTLEARNASAVDTRMLTVTAEAQPIIETFTVAPAFFTGASANVTITWATQNASTLTLTANGTAVPGFTGMASGTMTQNVDADTVFVLSASSGGGSAQETRSVVRTIMEAEPNDDIASAGSLGSGGGVQGNIETEDDVDFYSVTVPAGYALYAETSDGMGGCATDTILTLMNAAGDVLTSDDDSGAPTGEEIGACSKIDPAADLAAAELTAGTYYIRVSAYAPGGAYNLLVRLIEPGCGNGVWEAGRSEQCDDGNAASGDGCAMDCTLEVAGMLSGPPGSQVFAGTAEALRYTFYVLEVTADAYVNAQLYSPSSPTCPADDCELAVFDSAGAEVTYALGGMGECPHIDPNVDSSAFLEAGIYILGVGFYGTDGQTFPYEVDIELVAANICGNGVFEEGEQCDDGNAMDGDGCTTACRIEPLGTLNGPPGAQTFSGTAPGNELQFYEVTLTGEGYIEASVFTPTAPDCTGGADSVLYVADTDLATIAFDEDSGPELCSQVLPAFTTNPRLPAGQYFVATGFRGDPAMSFPYQLQITIRSVDVCGNGVAETGEQCDDGNTAANDGCSATCQFEIAATINPPSGNANLNLPSISSIQAVRVNITQAGQTLTATTTSGSSCDSDNVLELYNPDGTLRGVAAWGDANDCGQILETDGFAQNLPAGAYFLVVRPENGETGPVTLRVTILNPACGNGRLETLANEACDDTNTANGDGCSSTCQFEGNVLVEVEPNADTATAQSSGAVVATTRTIAGSINPVADVDYYAFTVPAGANRALVAKTYSQIGDPSVCMGIDTKLILFDGAGVEIARNDDMSNPSFSLCSEVSEANVPGAGVDALAPGTYYLAVSHWNDNAILSQYFLDIRLD